MLIHSINELPSLHSFDYIYISIGSKYNEDFVYYPPNCNIAKKKTNAPYQILPSFVRNRTEPTLCISIDRFSNVIHPNTPKPEQPIQLFLYDINEKSSFETILNPLFDLIDKSNCKNIIVANFIRFLSPNPKESKLELDLPDKLNNILSKRTYIFYQWFGYSPQLYSLLYSPRPTIFLHLNNIYQQLLKSTITELNVYTVSKIKDNDNRLWSSVLPHMIDFINTNEWNQSIGHKKDIV